MNLTKFEDVMSPARAPFEAALRNAYAMGVQDGAAHERKRVIEAISGSAPVAAASPAPPKVAPYSPPMILHPRPVPDLQDLKYGSLTRAARELLRLFGKEGLSASELVSGAHTLFGLSVTQEQARTTLKVMSRRGEAYRLERGRYVDKLPDGQAPAPDDDEDEV